MKKFSQKFSVVIVPLIILISFSLTGGSCENVLNNNDPIVSGDIIGDWKLVEQTGALQDICDDENINFGSAGIAVLTCPNTTSITRSYTVANNELTYTQTSISYNLEFSSDLLTLYMYGIDVSRNLTYEKIITSDHTISTSKKTDSNNSSEKRK